LRHARLSANLSSALRRKRIQQLQMDELLFHLLDRHFLVGLLGQRTGHFLHEQIAEQLLTAVHKLADVGGADGPGQLLGEILGQVIGAGFGFCAL